MSHTVADVVIARLKEAGVQALFGMPGGGSNLDLIEAAGRAGLPFVLSHTETAGALMACAQAELTGRPGACLATIGPGVASLVNGAAHAWLDRVPLMLLTDAMPASARNYQHQRVNHAGLLAPVTKGSFTLEAAGSDEIFTHALNLASASPPGPVHVDIAPDVSRTPAAATGQPPAAPEQSAGITLAAPLRTLLAGARHPLVIAGLGVRDAADADALRALCERHGIPALVTYKAKGVVPDEHPLFAGVFTHGALERPIVEQADLIIGVGLDPVEFLPRPWDCKAPCLILSRTWITEHAHLSEAVMLLGELPESLRAASECLPSSTDWKSADIRSNADRQRTALHIASRGWAPWQVVNAAAKTLGPNTQVTVDAGAHMLPIMGLWPARRPHQILISNGLSTMGFALPAAIGAALTDRTQRVVALTGDGGLLMCLAELATAARERLKVTVIVFNDRSLSLIRIKQERLGYPPVGMSLDGIDWQAAAATFGVPASRASNDDEMAECLAAAIATDGPVLIEAVVDPSSYPETLRALRG